MAGYSDPGGQRRQLPYATASETAEQTKVPKGLLAADRDIGMSTLGLRRHPMPTNVLSEFDVPSSLFATAAGKLNGGKIPHLSDAG